MKHSRDRDVMHRYASDESNALHAEPDGISGVWYPENEADIVELLAMASTDGQTLTVSGAGTGLTGARVPVHGGMVASMENMTRAGNWGTGQVIEKQGLAGSVGLRLDPAQGTAWVAPGISLSELDATLPRNWFYPPDPTERLASIGGTISTNASGARCFHYGPTRNWIDGLRVVLAGGDVLDLRRGECFADETGTLRFTSESGKGFSVKIPGYSMPGVKNAAGLYSMKGMDPIDLFIGSEGILGVISGAKIRLLPAEQDIAADLAFFPTVESALDFVDALRPLRTGGVLALEYFDGHALEFIRNQYPEIPEGAGAAILVELREGRKKNLAMLQERLDAHDSIEDWCACNATDLRDMKEFRHALPDSINAYVKMHGSHKLGTDLAVPPFRFREMMGHYRQSRARFEREFPREGPHCVTYGHVGDCHAHFNFIALNEDERRFARQLYSELAERAIGMGGTVSAEHGAGKRTLIMGNRTMPYLQLMYGEQGLREIARVKAALDPGGILNPGNMVPIGFT